MKWFESFGLDTLNECLWKDGAQIPLPPKPFAVLRYLVDNPGRLITHDELLDALWPETYVQPQVLRTYMLDLRKALHDDAGQPRFIQTLPKRGYRFVAPVKEELAANLPIAGASTVNPVVPTAPAATKIPALIGREQELDRLLALGEVLASGQRNVVFVTGETGIGKTALVDCFIELSCAKQECRSPRVARGQCVEGLDGSEPYYPVMEALGQLCASEDGEARSVLAKTAPAWMSVLGSGPGDTATMRSSGLDRMPGDLCAALEEVAKERALILILEDVHWADDSTLHLISALARRRAPAKLMVLATLMPRKNSDGANGHLLKGLKQDLTMRRLCSEIALTPLSKTAVRTLIGRELKLDELPPRLTNFVYRQSEGNPLFVFAILEHLIAQGSLIRTTDNGASHWEEGPTFEEAEAAVPQGLAQMIEFEMERLNPQERRMLEAGSLINVAFPAWAVAAALDEDALEIEEACDELARRLHFVERAGQDELPDGTRSAFYVFAHGLYREVLYHRQVATRRARRHVRVAERMGQLFAGREAHVAREMAAHYEAAGHWPRATEALRSAAQHALDRHSNAEAAELLQHALEIAANLNEQERGTAMREIGGELALIHKASANGSSTRRQMTTKP